MSQTRSKKRKAESGTSSDTKASSTSEEANKKLKVVARYEGDAEYARLLHDIAVQPEKRLLINNLFQYFASMGLGMDFLREEYLCAGITTSVVEETLHLALSPFRDVAKTSQGGYVLLSTWVTSNKVVLPGKRAVQFSPSSKGTYAFITVFREGDVLNDDVRSPKDLFCFFDLAHPGAVRLNNGRILKHKNRRMLLEKRLYPKRIDHVVSKIMSFLGET
jgi:hypothetical protein